MINMILNVFVLYRHRSPCWDCISVAMQHEWLIKYPTRKRPIPKEYNGVLGRLNSFVHIFQHMEK